MPKKSTLLPSPPSAPPPAACEPMTPSDVIRLMVEGHSVQDIREALQLRNPNDDPEQLIEVAHRHFGTIGESPEIITGLALECYRELYRRQVEIADFSGATKALTEMLKVSQRSSSPGSTRKLGAPTKIPEETWQKELKALSN